MKIEKQVEDKLRTLFQFLPKHFYVKKTKMHNEHLQILIYALNENHSQEKYFTTLTINTNENNIDDAIYEINGIIGKIKNYNFYNDYWRL